MNRGERLVRSVSATSVAVVFAAISHVLAGAAAPHILAVMVTIVVALPVALWLSGKRLSFPRLFTLVLGSQALFHVAFVMVGTTPLPSASAAGPHATHTASALALSPIVGPGDSSAVWLMWAAHAGAAIVTVIVLRFGERSAVTLATLVRDALEWLRTVRISPLPILGRRVTHSLPEASLLFQQSVLLSMPRRGPPRF